MSPNLKFLWTKNGVLEPVKSVFGGFSSKATKFYRAVTCRLVSGLIDQRQKD